MKQLIFFVIFILLLSCDDKRTFVKYNFRYIKDVGFLVKIDNEDRFLYKYDKTNRLLSIFEYKNGEINGKSMILNKNGVILERGNYSQGMKNGFFYIYNSHEKLIKIYEYVIVKNTSILNQVINIDANGKIIDHESIYFNLLADKDTIKNNELFEFNLEIGNSSHKDSIGVIIGNYDSLFQLVDTNNLLVGKYVVTDIMKFKITPKKKGKNIIRGTFIDYENFYDTTKTYTIHYFSKPFYVLP
jgi:hypothetical protein